MKWNYLQSHGVIAVEDIKRSPRGGYCVRTAEQDAILELLFSEYSLFQWLTYDIEGEDKWG